MRRNTVTSERILVRFIFGLGIILLAGCSLMVHPFTDELAGQPPVTTPSVDAIRAAQADRKSLVRPYVPVERKAQDGTVTHVPLYFEDPYEENGSDDGQFAWTVEDYWQLCYWRGRFLVNAIAFPVSAVVNPPWQVTASDGRPGLRAFGEVHDAKKFAATGQ